jgi:hypothetical protein
MITNRTLRPGDERIVSRLNEARHRMSGNNINLKFEHRSMPLIGALCRYPPQQIVCGA